MGPGSLALGPRQAKALESLRPQAAGAQVRIDPALIAHAQGYRLLVRPQGIVILAHDDAAAFYAAITLRQLLRQAPGRRLPCLRTEDWPDLPVRGYMLDISRDRVPTMPRLLRLVDFLAELKINQLQLYTEHTFAYRRHRTVWSQASPLTPAEIRRLDIYCRQRHIELVPNQNSFGHMGRWLKHPAYQHLAEAPDGFTTPWGDFSPVSSTLCPGDPRSLRFIAGLYDELLPNFSSRLFNVGCDETWDLGAGRSRAACKKRGKHRVYLDFLRRIHRLVQERGRTMQFWGDIILHQPELIAHLPADVIALEWGYEANHPFVEHMRQFATSGIATYVCPGTSTWNSLVARTDNALANLRQAATAGVAHGAVGYLITDWGDNGHLQPPSTSVLPLAFGAAAAWHLAANDDVPALLESVNTHFFHDPAGALARLVFDLGNAHLATGVTTGNASVLGELLWRSPGHTHAWMSKATTQGFLRARRVLAALRPRLKRIRLEGPEGRIVRAEFTFVLDLLALAADVGAACCRGQDRRVVAIPAPQRHPLARRLKPLLAEHRRLWLISSRPGGLPDSLGRLEALYAALNA